MGVGARPAVFWGLSAVVIAVLVGAPVALLLRSHLTGEAFGESCREDGDCRGLTTFCLKSRQPWMIDAERVEKLAGTCSRRCTKREDCPAGAVCAEVMKLERGRFSSEGTPAKACQFERVP